ncbi:MAG TPA: NAD(P)/FAD-dependent oxidoreductase [Xanthobacteraceae bacterium]|nr:NAD(P)/FAD-dependent oxidoreductase [Xanthobacteraceae bacterium]
MTEPRSTRRRFVRAATAGVAASVFPRPLLAQGSQQRIVVIGGGFAGATAARFLKRADPRFNVTLVEPNPVFAACPFSNEVIAGLREMRAQLFGYDSIAMEGVVVVHQAAAAVDGRARTVTLANGAKLTYERLVLAPGSDLRFDALPGYDESAAERMPHAWKAGEQTLLLRRQLEAMEDGGTVVMTLPALPYRCPPASYERASLIAYYLQTRKPRSKLVVLDAKDTFSMQRLFENAWQEFYPNLEWVPVSSGGNPTAVDATAMTVSSDFDTYKAAVANVIPPQKAGRIAERAGTADRTGWCPVDPITFESRLVPGIHVLGDAAIAGAVPKSAFAANAVAKICAAAVAKLVRGETPAMPKFVNTCYSLAAPDYGLSIAGVYRPVNGQWLEVEGAGGVSPVDAPRAFRNQEAKFANGWFNTITSEIFG